MKHYHTSAQIAEAKTVSKRAVEIRSAKESWPYDEVKGRGGKRRLYALADLPKDIQAAIQHHETSQKLKLVRADIEQEMANERSAKMLKKIEQDAKQEAREIERREQDNRRQYASLPNDSHRKQRARARYWVLSGALEHQHKHKITWNKARAEYVAMLVKQKSTCQRK